MYEIYIIGLFIFCAVITGAIAGSKNRDGLGWFILGLIFGPFAFSIALLPPRADERIQNNKPEGE